ncbi:MAG: thiaminase II [Pseudomonadota bacterium]
MTQTPDYGAAIAALRRAAGPTWQAYTEHDFVTGLGQGDLPREAFLHYLRQDYVFLLHFSRAWALAVVKAGNLAEMRAASATVHALLDEELKLHVALCGEAGISEAELEATEERAENLAYTRFVMDAGFSGDFLRLLAALAPCVLGYGEIGARLLASSTAETYADWIGTYGGAEYQETCVAVGKLLEDALTSRYGAGYRDLPIWTELCETFTTATRLEVSFWDMGLTP